MRTTEAYFERYGTWTVFLGRFITGLRVVVAPAAGAAGMPWSRFLPANAAGALGWASAVGLAGYFFGRSWQFLQPGLSWESGIMLAGVALAAVLLYVGRGSGRVAGQPSGSGGQS
jgi:membrane protein DedA with SNARE-associated domain